jgi:hypothetical protein
LEWWIKVGSVQNPSVIALIQTIIVLDLDDSSKF